MSIPSDKNWADKEAKRSASKYKLDDLRNAIAKIVKSIFLEQKPVFIALAQPIQDADLRKKCYNSSMKLISIGCRDLTDAEKWLLEGRMKLVAGNIEYFADNMETYARRRFEQEIAYNDSVDIEDYKAKTDYYKTSVETILMGERFGATEEQVAELMNAIDKAIDIFIIEAKKARQAGAALGG